MTDAKTNKRNFFLFLLLAITSLSLSSCYEPSPLYGVWADNKGNQITFNADSSYAATLLDSTLTSYVIEGSYTVLMNALTFTRDDGSTLVTEWDIRGNMLYLTWTFETETVNLTLYKIAD